MAIFTFKPFYFCYLTYPAYLLSVQENSNKILSKLSALFSSDTYYKEICIEIHNLSNGRLCQ